MKKESGIELLTQSKVASARNKTSKRIYIRDSKVIGLQLQITPKGAKSYQFRAWSSYFKRPQRVTIGSVDTITLKEARNKAQELSAAVVNKQDIEKISKFDDGSITVQELSEKFLAATRRDKRPATVTTYESHLKKNILPFIGPLPVNRVKKAHLIDLTERLLNEGKNGAANAVHCCIGSLFSYAERMSYIEITPYLRVSRPARLSIRNRELKNSELKQIWKACPDTSAGKVIKVMLLTGLRRAEVCNIHFNEIDGDTLTIPASRTKNGVQHKIYLSDTVQEIIGTGEGFCFPGKIEGRAITTSAVSYLGKRIFKSTGIKDAVLHDLRRKFRTVCSELEINRDTAERLINHKQKKDEVYDLHKYEVQKRRAMKVISSRYSKVLSDKKAKMLRIKKQSNE